MSDAALFDVIRRMKQRWAGAKLTQAEVNEINAALYTGTTTASATIPPFKPTDVIPSKKAPLVAIVGALAASSLFATVPKEEGTELRAYKDIAGIWTVCTGDTNDVHPGLIETPEGCRQRLEKQLVAHAGPVMACTPRLAEPGRDYQRAAAVSLAYNIGVRAYCGSTADKRFDAGDWRGACDAFLSWNKAKVAGVRRPVAGLTARRQRERVICLRGVA